MLFMQRAAIFTLKYIAHVGEELIGRFPVNEILWKKNRRKDQMLFSPNVSAIAKWIQTNEDKKWIVFTHAKPYLQTNLKLD